MDIRPYESGADAERLWDLKRAFEVELGDKGDPTMAAAYEGKLTDAYRERYLEWVDRCIAESAGCIPLAIGHGDAIGYAFLLPESLAMIWDAAVLNELYVVPEYRGKDVADRLLEEVLSIAKNQSLPMGRLLLDVAPSNERAIAFYERYGFQPWGQLLAKDLQLLPELTAPFDFESPVMARPVREPPERFDPVAAS